MACPLDPLMNSFDLLDDLDKIESARQRRNLLTATACVVVESFKVVYLSRIFYLVMSLFLLNCSQLFYFS